MKPRALFPLGVLLVVGAACAALVGWATSFVACENGGTPACDRQSLATAQFVLALVGLFPVYKLVRALWRNEGRRAARWLAVSVLAYLAWGVLNDAAVHGWDDLKVFG